MQVLLLICEGGVTGSQSKLDDGYILPYRLFGNACRRLASCTRQLCLDKKLVVEQHSGLCIVPHCFKGPADHFVVHVIIPRFGGVSIMPK